MNSIIQNAIDIIGDATPLKIDCGELCSHACCVCDGSMIVMPEEMDRLKDRGYTFDTKDMINYGKCTTVTCDGTCERAFRPYSCMIFPLAPKIINDKVYVRLDARGRPVCPLCHQSVKGLQKDFVEKVKKSLQYLYEQNETRDMVIALSKLVDMYEVPFL